MPDGETEQSQLTFEDVDLRARAIGGWLQSISAGGERVVLLLPSGPEFVTAFVGCLYAGAVAVPAYPLDPTRLRRTALRLASIVTDARPVVALTTRDSLAAIEQLLPHHPELASVRWTAVETISDALAGEWSDPKPAPDDLMVLQYTSGSTASPRGVCVTQRNTLENSAMISALYPAQGETTYVTWLPLSHDLGLFCYVLQPMLHGMQSVIMPPEAFIQKPVRWLRALSRGGDVASAAPNFGYELCIRRVSAEDRATLDLRGWRVAVFGAEPTRAETLARFAAEFSSCGFRREACHDGYGLAEATLVISTTRDSRVVRFRKDDLERGRGVPESDPLKPAVTLVSAGRAAPRVQIRIVNPEPQVASLPGEIGEIWVSGPNIASGYWNNAAATSETFCAFLKDTGEGPFLRTGDLGFLCDGELFVAGRMKDLIIIRGRNLLPQDLEGAVAGCHRAVRPGCTIAFSMDIEGEERLAVAQEVRAGECEVDEVIEAIRKAVFEECGVLPYAVILVPPGAIPKTSSGKLQRGACRAAYVAGQFEIVGQSILDGTWLARERDTTYVAPRTPAEKKLAEIWSSSLKVEKVGIHDRFFDLGGDSLLATQCVAEICAAFGLNDVAPDVFLYATTLEQMARAVTDGVNARASMVQPIQPVGDGTPLFLVGAGIEFRHLARYLGPDRPIYDVCCPNLEHLPAAFSIEQIAAQCVESLRRFRPHGPYVLAGWCAAGVIAMEMARQLDEAGAEVASLILLDVFNFYPEKMSSPKALLVRACYGVERLLFLASRMRRHGLRPLRDAAARRILWGHKVMQRAAGDGARTVDEGTVLALKRYNPRPWTGRLVHIWASDRPRGPFAQVEFGWSHLVPGGFEFHETPGNHVTMLHDPNVSAVAKILASELDSVPGKRSLAAAAR